MAARLIADIVPLPRAFYGGGIRILVDFSDPTEEGTYIVERAGGKLELIEVVGHYPQTEMPEETASVIVGFLNHTG